MAYIAGQKIRRCRRRKQTEGGSSCEICLASDTPYIHRVRQTVSGGLGKRRGEGAESENAIHDSVAGHRIKKNGRRWKTSLVV